MILTYSVHQTVVWPRFVKHEIFVMLTFQDFSRFYISQSVIFAIELGVVMKGALRMKFAVGIFRIWPCVEFIKCWVLDRKWPHEFNLDLVLGLVVFSAQQDFEYTRDEYDERLHVSCRFWIHTRHFGGNLFIFVYIKL